MQHSTLQTRSWTTCGHSCEVELVLTLNVKLVEVVQQLGLKPLQALGFAVNNGLNKRRIKKRQRPVSAHFTVSG